MNTSLEPAGASDEALISEDELLQAARMKLRVEVSTLLAHDLGNQLTVIHNAAQMLGEQAKKQDQTLLDLILVSSSRSMALTRQLQGLAGEGVEAAGSTDCNALIRDAAAMLTSVMGGAVTVDYELAQAAVPAAIEPAALSEVLLNLALNARDAMPNGGVFHISVKREAPSADVAFPGPECVHLTVRDTGCGMDEQTRLKAFDPYFSLKPAGHGCGLGLASVERTIRRSGGAVHLESHLGKGTRFDFYLPLFVQRQR